VRRRDELVGVRLDADRRADQDGLDHAVPLRRMREPGDLFERVDDDPADPGLDGGVQLALRLVAAVKTDPLRREAGAQRGRQLATGAHVEPEAFLVDPARRGQAQKRLAGVVDVAVGKGSPPGPAAGAEVVLVEHVGRSAVLDGEVADVDVADVQHAAHPPGRRRPHAGIEVGRVVWRLNRRGVAHMRSGAETPSRPSPLRTTIWVAVHSHSRARLRSVTGSSPRGRTRQAS
jgi:hypothetical protein